MSYEGKYLGEKAFSPFHPYGKSTVLWSFKESKEGERKRKVLEKNLSKKSEGKKENAAVGSPAKTGGPPTEKKTNGGKQECLSIKMPKP